MLVYCVKVHYVLVRKLSSARDACMLRCVSMDAYMQYCVGDRSPRWAQEKDEMRRHERKLAKAERPQLVK